MTVYRAAAFAAIFAIHVLAQGAVPAQTVDLKFREESYQKFLKEGASYAVRIPLTGPLAYVKVVVYDYAADLVGTAVAKPQ